MRLIDADALDELLEIGRDCEHCKIGRENCDHVKLAVIEICGIIAEQKTVDAVEVIRCEKCRYYKEYIEPHGVKMTECWYGHPTWTEPNGYCHRARRANKYD